MSNTRLLPLLLIALCPTTLIAQDAEPTAAPPEGWHGTGELGLALARGNARSENLNAKLAMGKESDVWRHDFYLSMLRAKGEVTGDFNGDGVPEERYALSANRLDAGASSAYKFDDRSYMVGALRYENDDFSPYDYQATAAVGYGYYFVKNDRTTFSGEIGPGYRRGRNAETGEIESGVIARGLLDLSHQLTDTTELFNTFLVESGSDNTFMRNDFGIAVAISDAFALKAGLQARRNSDVEPGIKTTDTLTTLNLVYNIE